MPWDKDKAREYSKQRSRLIYEKYLDHDRMKQELENKKQEYNLLQAKFNAMLMKHRKLEMICLKLGYI